MIADEVSLRRALFGERGGVSPMVLTLILRWNCPDHGMGFARSCQISSRRSFWHGQAR